MRAVGLNATQTSRARFGLADIVAGVSVALILVPQALAYAEIAGVPSYVGLYAAALPPIAAAFFASSPYLQTGPVAMTALLTFGALSAIAEPFTAEWVALAALLAILVGVARLAFGLLRAGVIAFLMSQPVLLGFTSAAAILIIGSQVPLAFGVEADGETILSRAWWTATHVSEWNWTAVVITIATIVIVVGGRRISRLLPGVLVAVVLAIVAVQMFGLEVETVGSIPAGLPPFSLDLPWGETLGLIIPAAVIALVGFAEPAAIARAFAAEERQSWDPDREFVSQGAANLASGLSGGFPVGGSFSRSSVNKIAGARTRWAGAVTGVAVLLFLPVSSILESLPLAVLAGIVISAVAKLVRPDLIVKVAATSPAQGAVAIVTFAATLIAAPRIEIAVIIGVGLGVGIHLWRELTTHVDSSYADGTLRLTPSGVMFFASTPALYDSLLSELSQHPNADTLVLDLSRLGRLDYTGALSLETLVKDAAEGGLAVRLVNIPPQSVRIVGKVEGLADCLE